MGYAAYHSSGLSNLFLAKFFSRERVRKTLEAIFDYQMFEGKSTLDERTCFLIENPQYSDTKIFKLVPWIGFLGGKFGRA